ncbi:MAG: putative sporulation protein YtxC [Defluviitaleaceae bacterium]|nr:putative sporulation protein YtxC [Defluviitaleaceae bacterium]
MKRVTLHTEHYIPLLREFAQSWGRGAWVADIMRLLAEVAMRENAIYAHAPRMREFAQSLSDAPMYRREAAQLKRFLHDNDRLHLEGYVRFRMRAYAEMLDMLSYRLIKKLRICANED